jgi:hypothetical protein
MYIAFCVSRVDIRRVWTQPEEWDTEAVKRERDDEKESKRGDAQPNDTETKYVPTGVVIIAAVKPTSFQMTCLEFLLAS